MSLRNTIGSADFETTDFAFPQDAVAGLCADAEYFAHLLNAHYIGIYHVENIVFRVSILWDMLAQLCNIIYQTKVDLKKLHCGRYFDAFSKGDKSFEFAKEVNDYLEEKEDTSISWIFWIICERFPH